MDHYTITGLTVLIFDRNIPHFTMSRVDTGNQTRVSSVRGQNINLSAARQLTMVQSIATSATI